MQQGYGSKPYSHHLPSLSSRYLTPPPLALRRSHGHIEGNWILLQLPWNGQQNGLLMKGQSINVSLDELHIIYFGGVVQSCISRQLRKTPHKPPRNLVLGVNIKMMLHHDLQYYIVTIYFALGITIGIIDCRLLAMLATKINPILIHPDISLLA